MKRQSSLPQHDSNPAQREAEIQQAREAYPIDRELLPPLFFTDGILPVEKPPSDWLSAIGQGARDIALNQIANKRAWLESAGLGGFSEPGDGGDDDEVPKDPAAVLEARKQAVAALDELQDTNDYFGELVSDLDALHDGVTPDEPVFFGRAEPSQDAVRKEILARYEQLHRGRSSVGTSVVGKAARAMLSKIWGPAGRPIDADQYTRLYRKIEKPAVLRRVSKQKFFNQDSEFARQRLDGLHPIKLERVERIVDHFPVTEDHFSVAMGADDSLAGALAEGRVFLCDYSHLEGILEPSRTLFGVPHYVYAPLALFSVPRGGGALRPVAIQVSPTPGPSSPIFTPNHKWRWQQAKTVVQVADVDWHEVITHIGHIHMMVPPFIFAMHHELSPSHPLHQLLSPHFATTLTTNKFVSIDMTVPGGLLDRNVGSTLESSCRLAIDALERRSFRSLFLHADLERRGVMDREVLRDYPYRDDGLRLWGAIERWVRAYLSHWYRRPGDFAADHELARWRRRLTGSFASTGVHGLGAIDGLDDLIDIVTMLVYTTTAHHSSIHFGQYDYMGHGPSMSGAGWAPPPSTTAGGGSREWLDMLPPLEIAELQAESFWMLTRPRPKLIGDYGPRDRSGACSLTDRHVRDVLLPAFRRDLDTIESQIRADNADPTRRARPYEYMLPSRIPESITV